jgi:hypothetical protein
MYGTGHVSIDPSELNKENKITVDTLFIKKYKVLN